MMVTALARLGFIGEGANIQTIERAVGMLIDQYYGVSLGQVHNLNMRDIMQDIVELLYGQPFHIPAQFAFSGSAVSTLVGVATGLAPEFNFIEVAAPYARNFLGLGGEGTRETIQLALTKLIETGRLLITLPRTVERLITKIESGQMEVKLANQYRPLTQNRTLATAETVALW